MGNFDDMIVNNGLLFGVILPHFHSVSSDFVVLAELAVSVCE